MFHIKPIESLVLTFISRYVAVKIIGICVETLSEYWLHHIYWAVIYLDMYGVQNFMISHGNAE